MTSYNGASNTWMGRELRKITSGSNTYSYKYNADGIRTSKTVNGTTTEFFLNGTQILAQKTGDSVMRFIYDSTGKRVGFANGRGYIYSYDALGRPTRVDCTDGNWLQYGYNTVDQSTFLRYHFGGVTRTTFYTLSADCLSFLIKSGRPIWSDGHEKRLAATDCQP